MKTFEINKMAFLVHGHTKKKANDNNYTFDIVTILTIANIIIKLIMMIRDMKGGSDEEVADELQNMGPLRRLALRWIIFKNVKRAGERKYVFDGIRDSFKDLDKESVVKLVAEQK